jgi:hypothetical protein
MGNYIAIIEGQHDGSPLGESNQADGTGRRGSV